MRNFHSVGVILTLSIFVTEISINPVTSGYTFYVGSKDKCGYASCPKPKKDYINVHIVPHTHNEIGWRKTFNQYFYGSRNKTNIKHAGVKTIIDSVIKCLWGHPKRRFVYAETAYFWKWWQKQDGETQRKVRTLVKEGRLEFVGGGWSIHDEAITHYQSIIDQMSYGLRKLHDLFGRCGRPRVGWQIDPYGHSRESASIMARLGFDGLFVDRINVLDRGIRRRDKKLELIWEASPNLGSKSDLFTSVLYNMSNEPNQFCFDILCDDPEIVDDRLNENYNADIKAKNFVEYIKNMSRSYTSNNVLVTMGQNFSYKYAEKNFKNLDRLIRAVNNLQDNSTKVNLFYSTPSCYLKAVNEEKLTYTVKEDDFIPYSTGENVYWSGFYSSRTTLKYLERIGNNFLQICKQLFALSNLDEKEMTKLNNMSEAMAILQNHQGITGTSRQCVVNDYIMRLNRGFVECSNLTDGALRKLMVKSTENGDHEDSLLKSCMYLNISSCPITENNNRFVVTVYNPLSRNVTHHVRMPVRKGENYTIIDPSGNILDFQILPIPNSVLKIPGRESKAEFEIVFVAYSIPPLGFKSYYVRVGQHGRPIPSYTKKQSFTYNNVPKRTLTFGNVTIQQKFGWYRCHPRKDHYTQWLREVTKMPSGPYILTMVNLYRRYDNPEFKIYTGPIVDEVHEFHTEWISQVIRKYHANNYLEFQWLIGPTPVDDDPFSKEVVTKYTVKEIATNKTFYMDSNGREMLKRVRDLRLYNEPLEGTQLSGNYRPVTTRIMMKDNYTQVSIITDRAFGGTSMYDGQLELMIHRRIPYNASTGLDEALNETAFGNGIVVRGTHFVTAGNPINQSALDRIIIQEKVLSAWSFFTPTKISFKKWKRKHKMEYSGLKTVLPPNVQVLTLEPWSSYTYLIRLEHIMDKNDDSKLSEPVTLNLQDIFQPFHIISMRETTLGGNELLRNLKRLLWKKDSETTTEKTGPLKTEHTDILHKITLKPMEIRSFLVEIDHK